VIASVALKEVPPTTFVVSSHDDVTIPEIPAITRGEVDQLIATIEQEGLVATSPVVFIYHGADGTPTTRFKFALAFPLAERPASVPEPYELVDAPTFKCLSTDFVGAMPDIMAGYARLFDAVDELGLSFTGESREIYRKWIGFESDDNVTELQLGVK
jgi:effector-binding domain-containing protein